jgi:methionyl-tRNA formyltransferase
MSAAEAGRIVFMGSPEFAVPSLRALARNFTVACVVTQPDRPAGRGRQLVEPPVKRAALELGLPLWQPETLRGAAALAHLRRLEPDCVVVAAYGEIIRPRMLAAVPQGFVNVHASLLPRYRGASPISAAILNGDAEAGVSIMLLDAGMDTGPVLAQQAIPVAADATRGTLEADLAGVGAGLLARVLPDWLAGRITPTPQDERLATGTRPIEREDGRIDWTAPAAAIERLCRAMDPWPNAFTYWEGKLLKIVRGAVAPGVAGAVPGTVLSGGGGVAVACGTGSLRLLTLQPEGRGPMSADDFARGRPQFTGANLGTRD